MGPFRRSYILLVQKSQTTEMLDKWSPTSKLSDIKFSHYPAGRYVFLFLFLFKNPPVRHTY